MTNKVLVTGGTGFLGMRLINQLLKDGYEVRTTVRNLKSQDKVIKTMQDNGADTAKLTFAAADLSHDTGWDKAMEGIDYVFSVASPVFFEIPKDEEEVIRPAIDGITRILKAAKSAGVKRVVMTSNFGAVGFSNMDKNSVTTEDNWTDVNVKGLSAYEKSKLLAEKAAWDYIKGEGRGLEFATINPVAIYGPSLDSHVSGSFHLLENLMNGQMKRVPNIPLNVVDVRDVINLHIRAIFTPEANMERFIATSDGQISLPEIAALIRRERPEAAGKVSDKTVPNAALNIGALFNKQAREGKLLLNMNRNVSNDKAKSILGWTPVADKEQAVLAAVDSMIKYQLVK